jgi:hypothetical protein
MLAAGLMSRRGVSGGDGEVEALLQEQDVGDDALVVALPRLTRHRGDRAAAEDARAGFGVELRFSTGTSS